MTGTTSVSTAPAAGHDVFSIRSEEPTITWLEATTSRISQALRDHDFDNPAFEYLAPDCYAAWDGFPVCTSREQYVATVGAIMREAPRYCYEDLMMCTSLHGTTKRKATVWVTVRITGLPLLGSEGLSRESVIKLDWRRRKEGWQCVSITGIRGSTAWTRGC